MADSQLILDVFLHIRGGCSLVVLLFFLMLVGIIYHSSDFVASIDLQQRLRCFLVILDDSLHLYENQTLANE